MGNIVRGVLPRGTLVGNIVGGIVQRDIGGKYCPGVLSRGTFTVCNIVRGVLTKLSRGTFTVGNIVRGVLSRGTLVGNIAGGIVQRNIHGG